MQQTLFKPQPNTPTAPGGKNRSQTIIFTALALFALSGLMIGFVVGIFTHTKQSSTTNQNQHTSSGVVSHQQNPSQTPTIRPTNMGCPTPTTFNNAGQADGTTPYTFVAQVQKPVPSCSATSNTPMHVSGVTFKLWLIQSLPDGKGIAFPDGAQKILNAIAQPTIGKMLDLKSGKVQDQSITAVPGLTFDLTTPQVQTSNDQGQVTWKYTIPPTLQNGSYDFVLLADWAGQSYNWSWWQFTVTKAGNN